MIAQILDRVITAYRIGDPDGRFPIYSAEGSRLFPGRWNTPATPMIYASQHYSTALLEKLVHGNGKLPPNQHYIRITIPNGLSYEVVTPATLPGWDRRTSADARRFGIAWRTERRSALLFVPSLPARVDRNILINPAHPEFSRITCDLHEPVWWTGGCSGPSVPTQKFVAEFPGH